MVQTGKQTRIFPDLFQNGFDHPTNRVRLQFKTEGNFHSRLFNPDYRSGKKHIPRPTQGIITNSAGSPDAESAASQS
jgi:hypothetical protein